jgi:hypothetical protein
MIWYAVGGNRAMWCKQFLLMGKQGSNHGGTERYRPGCPNNATDNVNRIGTLDAALRMEDSEISTAAFEGHPHRDGDQHPTPQTAAAQSIGHESGQRENCR